jgi:hypothetical protein
MSSRSVNGAVDHEAGENNNESAMTDDGNQLQQPQQNNEKATVLAATAISSLKSTPVQPTTDDLSSTTIGTNDVALEDEMDRFLEILNRRVHGEVSNEKVELAISGILSKIGAVVPPGPSSVADIKAAAAAGGGGAAAAIGTADIGTVTSSISRRGTDAAQTKARASKGGNNNNNNNTITKSSKRRNVSYGRQPEAAIQMDTGNYDDDDDDDDKHDESTINDADKGKDQTPESIYSPTRRSPRLKPTSTLASIPYSASTFADTATKKQDERGRNRVTFQSLESDVIIKSTTSKLALSNRVTSRKRRSSDGTTDEEKSEHKEIGADGDHEEMDKSKEENHNDKEDENSSSKSETIHSDEDENEEDYEDIISQIPMGREAAKMMTAFGDGPQPNPQALEKALLGTRHSLQLAIMDARKVRRRLQQDYESARKTVTPYRYRDKKKRKSSGVVMDADVDATAVTSSSTATASVGTAPKSATPKALTSAGSINPQMLYRALAEGHDKLSYDHKCGFHMEELTHLFPEEMRAYQRWNEMHEEYEHSGTESKTVPVDIVDDDGDVVLESSGTKSSQQSDGIPIPDEVDTTEPDGGHLRERAANFDLRTDRMDGEWYVSQYAKVRQGSFLSRGNQTKRSALEIEWDKGRRKRGKQASGTWENMSAKSVRFLHWVGFDPPNLFPPDQEVTEALAFLAYDRLGQIIEKAIFIRNNGVVPEGGGWRCPSMNIDGDGVTHQEGKDGRQTVASVWEIPEGEQLSAEDIERALQDADIKPAAVHGSHDGSRLSVQKYFGPGWEERLELEMEE